MSNNRPAENVIVGAQSLCKVVENPGGGHLDILTELTLEIKRGETVAITGASGSGKSTLLGLLAGLDHPTSGKVWLNGNLLTELNEDQRAAIRSNTTGFVFQGFHLLPSLTALENVMLPLELSGQKDATREATLSLERVGLADRLDHYPAKLSGGEQQRVAIARAFVTHPVVLFADEPTGNLDKKTGSSIADLLFTLNQKEGTTLVLVSHDPSLAQRCNKTLVLEDGQLESQV